MAAKFFEYRSKPQMYWVLFITFYGIIHQVWQCAIEFNGRLQMRNNQTRMDYVFHTICDVLMFITSLLAFCRFNFLWDYVGMIWFSLYLIYHYQTVVVEEYNYN